jgi:8-oxo-dGTP pyrophosphatase MutT (NUDIX family)
LIKLGYLADITRQLNNNQDVIFVGTGVILVDSNNNILMACRTDNSEWSLPGGSLEIGESLLHCAARETFEETGIIVEEKNLHLNTAQAIPTPIIKNDRKIFVVSVSYWSDTYDDIDFNLDSREFTKYGWFSEEEISKLGKTTPYSKIALETYLEERKNGKQLQ